MARVDGRPNDGMFKRFNYEVMPELMDLVGRFEGEKEAALFYRSLARKAFFKNLVKDHLERDLPIEFVFWDRSYRCTDYAAFGESITSHGSVVELTPDRRGPLEILHILAHYLQPSGTAWHGAEFAKAFKTLVERMFGADVRREVNDVLLKYGIKTKVVGPETRAKQAAAYNKRRAADVPAKLLAILREAEKLGESNE